MGEGGEYEEKLDGECRAYLLNAVEACYEVAYTPLYQCNEIQLVFIVGEEQMRKDKHAVYTPENEPYLGIEALRMFDLVIVEVLKQNEASAKYTREHVDSLTDLQHAACQIIPQGISIALSVREMIRQGYLLSAEILMRPLIERVAIIEYLRSKPEDVHIWKEGWKHGKRPKLAIMLGFMGMTEEEAKEVCALHSHLVHGDPFSANSNLIPVSAGSVGYASSKILNNPRQAELTAAEALSYMIVLKRSMEDIFPNSVSSQS